MYQSEYRKILKFVFVLFTFLSSSCVSEPVVEEKKAMVYCMLQYDGLGDRGYNDAVYEGLLRSRAKDKITLACAIPESPAYAESFFLSWLMQDSQAGSLFVLASHEYEFLVEKYQQLIKDKGRSVLLFESDRTDLPVNTIYLNMYGSSYLLAKGLQQLSGIDSVATLSFTEEVNFVHDALQGFSDGWARDVKQASCLLNDSSHTSRIDRIYREVARLHQQGADFVLPLVSGANAGVLAYTREWCSAANPLFVAGIDVEQSVYSEFVVASFVKDLTGLVELHIDRWLQDPLTVEHAVYGMESPYIKLVPRVYSSTFDFLNLQTYIQDYTHFQQALQAEIRYEKKTE